MLRLHNSHVIRLIEGVEYIYVFKATNSTTIKSPNHIKFRLLPFDILSLLLFRLKWLNFVLKYGCGLVV